MTVIVNYSMHLDVNKIIMGERKLKEQFSTLAERLRSAQLSVEQLGELQSIKCFYTDDREEQGCAKRRAFPIRLLLLLLIFFCRRFDDVTSLADSSSFARCFRFAGNTTQI